MSKNNKKKYSDDQLFGQDEYFYFIAGYTESGFAYGRGNCRWSRR
ncbi:hypothetical protein [Sporosarcina sp. ITBMC105]